jgi:hypothetical protein
MAVVAVQRATAPAPPEQRYSLALDHVTERTPGQVRRVLDTLLGQWGLTGFVDGARLVATELLTNVHRHADGRCDFVLLAGAAGVHIQVRDYSVAELRMAPITLDRECGRGLLTISQYSTLHVRALPDGTVISAFLATPSATDKQLPAR